MRQGVLVQEMPQRDMGSGKKSGGKGGQKEPGVLLDDFFHADPAFHCRGLSHRARQAM